jgi:tetratricopeptide (TPR) repeat protein
LNRTEKETLPLSSFARRYGVKIASIVALALCFACGHLKEARKSMEMGQYDRTISMCLTALKEDSLDYRAWSLLGAAYLAKDDLDSALIAVTRAQETDTTRPEYQRKIFQIKVRQGDCFAESGEWRKALEQFDTALAIYPDSPAVFHKIGDAFFALGQHDKATAEYGKCLSSPDSLTAAGKIARIDSLAAESEDMVARGMVHLQNKRYEKARAVFEKALEIKPDNLEAKYQRHIAWGLRRYKKGSKSALWDAIEEFGYASTLKPHLGEPLYYMGLSYNKKDRNEFDNAIETLEKASAVEPDGPFAELAREKALEIRRRRKKLRDFWDGK